MRWGRWIVVPVVTITLVAGCKGGSSGSRASSAGNSALPETTGTDPAAPATTGARAASPGSFDDLNQDGVPDPTCGTKDFGGGLVLTLLCDGGAYASEPSAGTTLVPGSLYGLPSISDDLKARLLTDVSANAIQARDPGGKQVVVFFIQSDTLFDVGSAALSDPARATLDGLARNIKATWPAAPIQVRGHTDSTGNASANQVLSEQRATNVTGYLATRGFDRATLTSIGFGSTQPIALERNPDGSESVAGRRENRRVELVVRIP
jgi:outer membrane protein OmpA-like peptidoglycan-associated protein